MGSIKFVILGLCFVAVLIQSAQADVKCYECKGGSDGDCAKGVVSAMNVVDCPGFLAMCHHQDVRNGHIRSFSRGCTQYAKPDLCTLLYMFAAQNPTELKVFSCNTCWSEKCNTGTTE